MVKSMSAIYVHLIFCTKQRRPILNPGIMKDLYSYIGGICRNLECPMMAISGVRDHLHILCSMSRTISASTLVEGIKKSSSKWIKNKGQEYSDFQWQAGYGAFSIGQSGVSSLRAYIEKQEEHHKRQTFQDEYRAFLRKYKIEFDERYVWD